MRKQLLLLKTLLVAVLLGAGTSAWGAAALTKKLEVTGYTAVNLFDFQNKDYDGTALANFEALADLGVTSQCTIQTAYGTNNWYDDTANNHGLRLQSGGGRWIQFTVDINKDDYIIINGGAASESYEISMTNGESVSVTGATDYLCFKATQDASTLRLTVHRYNYLLQILIMTKDGSAETADYTINYKASGETVKTVSGNEAVGTEIPVLSSFFANDKKYYTDGGQASSLTVTAGGSTLNINVTEAAQYTCTVNAKAGDVLLATKNESLYDNESTTIYYQMAYAKDGKWYFVDKNASSPGYGVAFNSVTSNQTQNVTTYAVNNDVVYFGEAEDMTLVGSWAANGAYLNWRSNGGAKRLAKNSYIYTSTIASGVYDVTMWARNQRSAGAGTETLPLYLRDEDGNLTDLEVSFPGWARGGFEAAYTATITIPDDGKNYSIVIRNTQEDYSSNLEMDYVYVTLVKPVSVTVTDAGYATYVNSDYDLDFSSTTIEAYKVKVSTKGLATLTKVNEVPAGTPVLLYANGSASESIPVMTGAAAVTDNDLVAGTTTTATDGVPTTDGDNTNMILNVVDEQIGFYFANDKTVATDRAYLHIASDMAPDAQTPSRMRIVFAGETTGVKSLPTSQKGEESVYNLAGQRVKKPTKGLYVKGGKKVIVK